jgi:hypothetical protein
LPPAKESSYPDCYFTTTVAFEHIISGRSIPNKIVLVLQGFFARQYAPEARFKVGDKIRATVVPFESMPDQIRQTRQADEIEDVAMKFYFPEKVALIQAFQSVTQPVPFAGNERDVENKVELKQIDAGAKAARRESMRRDLAQINKLLAEHGGDWDKWYDSLKGFRTEYDKKYDAKAQKWIGDSFFSAGLIRNDEIYVPEFVQSMIAFKNYLSARNVDLIVVRVPEKGEIVSDLFTSLPKDQVINPYLLRLYKELLEADIEIITDIIPKAEEARLKYPLMYWYQVFSEEHPSEGMCWVIAEELARRVSRYARIRSMPKAKYELRKESRPDNDIHWPSGNPKFNPAEYVDFSAVAGNDGNPLKLKQGTESPVLIAGSSFIAVPSLEKSASIPHYFAYLTGIAPDILFRSGSDLTIPRSIAREGDDFLKNREVVLFPFRAETTYTKLTSPPLVNPDKVKKTLLASYSGKLLHDMIQIIPPVAEHVFTFSPEDELIIRPADMGQIATGKFRLQMPLDVTKFRIILVEIMFQKPTHAKIVGRYSGQTDYVDRSYTESKKEDVFIFKSEKQSIVELDFTDIRYNQPTIINGIKIYGAL